MPCLVFLQERVAGLHLATFLHSHRALRQAYHPWTAKGKATVLTSASQLQGHVCTSQFFRTTLFALHLGFPMRPTLLHIAGNRVVRPTNCTAIRAPRCGICES